MWGGPPVLYLCMCVEDASPGDPTSPPLGVVQVATQRTSPPQGFSNCDRKARQSLSGISRWVSRRRCSACWVTHEDCKIHALVQVSTKRRSSSRTSRICASKGQWGNDNSRPSYQRRALEATKTNSFEALYYSLFIGGRTEGNRGKKCRRTFAAGASLHSYFVFIRVWHLTCDGTLPSIKYVSRLP